MLLPRWSQPPCMNIEVTTLSHLSPPSGHTRGPLIGWLVSSAGIIPNSHTERISTGSAPPPWIRNQTAMLAAMRPTVNTGVSSAGFSSR